MINRFGILSVSLLFLLCFTACDDSSSSSSSGGADSTQAQSNEGTPERGDWIRIYNPSDPDALHPYASFHASASYVKDHLFQFLCDINPQTLELVPVLAKERGTASPDGLSYSFEIREEAVWDNGSPITGYDYEFSMKAIKNPLTEAPHIRAYYVFIKDVKVDASNPKKFTVYTESPFFLGETAISGIDIIPKYFYDPNGKLDKFTVQDFFNDESSLEKDSDLIEWSTEFHDVKYKREPEFIVGSGAYKVESWTSGDNITLVRKSDWWGDQLSELGFGFNGYADKIIYKTITNRQAAIRAAAAGEIDVVRDIPATDFIKIQDGKDGIKDKFNLHTPDTYSTVYLGMNCRPSAGRSPFLEDRRVRMALTHLLDVDRVIEKIYEGFGKRIVGPVSINNKDEYNANLKPIPFDPEKAKQLLDEAGWIDTDNDGVRDKVIRGKKTPFEIEIMVSNSSQTAPRVAEMLSQEAAKAGLTVNVNRTQFSTMTGKLREHDFDMFGAGFIGSPIPTDLRQLWHTEAWLQNGSNYFGFGTAHTDSLIDKIRVTLDANERKPMYDEMQTIIQEEAPVIFLHSPIERIIIHKRFRNAFPSVDRPGYSPQEFWVPKDEQLFGKEAS